MFSALKRFSLFFLVLVLSACGAGPQDPRSTLGETAAAEPPAAKRTPLVVFCAGSLILPFGDLEAAFERLHPEVDVLNECHGSIQVIRHVTELHEKIDVVATADYALIPQLMYAAADPETGKPYAAWYLRFAGNRLALAYRQDSPFAVGEIRQDWPERLLQPGVKVGLADPRFDASGYRALMALKLAETALDRPGLLASWVKDQFSYPITQFAGDETTLIRVPEILETKSGARIVLRGASIQLIALLESGELDYAFEYESVIRQHNLPYVALPEAINLGAAEQAAAYGAVEVRLEFRRFASVKPSFRGEPIGYGLVIPSNAPQPELAAEFIAFTLGEQGRAIMAANYQPLLDPPACDHPEAMPATLQDLCGPEEKP